MRLNYLLLLLVSFTSFSQNTTISITIDSILSNDPNPKEREFTINYHIENLSDNAISFILNTNSVRPNATSSMSYFPAYRLFQGNEIINAVSFLNCKSDIEWRQKRKKDSELKLGQPKKDAKKNVQNLTAELKLQTSQTILTSIIKLNPKEIKNFSTILIWDKNRYSQYFDSEYYLGEREIHYLDFNLNLMKEELKEKVTPEVFKTIMEDKTIIKGWIQSNKMEIYFKE